jgi:hypothetical protein
MAGASAVEALDIGLPQALQNRADAVFSTPHLLQGTVAAGSTGAGAAATLRRSNPHPLQNLALSPFSTAHLGQIMVMFPPS